jgi:hypothetical protein
MMKTAHAHPDNLLLYEKFVAGDAKDSTGSMSRLLELPR